jgi:3-polyprenyl-4-hydroxybenzoate decarboxylase
MSQSKETVGSRLRIGVPPNISYAAVARIAPELDEFAVAGVIAGAPVELIRCKTVDLLVSRAGEIVSRGTARTDLPLAFVRAQSHLGRVLNNSLAFCAPEMASA